MRAGESIGDGFVVEHSSQTKVRDPDSALTIQQDVLGLDVSMDDALIVSVLQRFAELRNDREGFGRFNRTRLNRLPQIDSVDVLHDQEVEVSGLS